MILWQPVLQYGCRILFLSRFPRRCGSICPITTFLSRVRLEEEQGLIPLYEEWCSIRWHVGVGAFAGGNIFFWRVSVYDDFMIIVLFWRPLISYREIERVENKETAALESSSY